MAARPAVSSYTSVDDDAVVPKPDMELQRSHRRSEQIESATKNFFSVERILVQVSVVCTSSADYCIIDTAVSTADNMCLR